MKVAILSVSENGKATASNLKEKLEEDYTTIKVNTFHKNIKTNINTIFNSYDAIIGIMATGILIRSISDQIQSKTTDPAILAMGENGKFVISLISGHIGRGNELAKKIARLLNAQEVITTSTDLNNKLGIDTLANKYYWKINNTKSILNFNKAILKDKNIKLSIKQYSNTYTYLDDLKRYLNKFLNSFTLEINDLKNQDSSMKNVEKDNKTSIINKNFNSRNKSPEIVATFDDYNITFTPQKIVIGIGARKDIVAENAIEAIKIAMNNLNLPIARIDSLATAEIKKNEEGIIEAGKLIKKPLNVVSLDQIRKIGLQNEEISSSKFVNENFNIPGVCEPSALIIAGEDSKLIHRKIAKNGVTIAVAVSK